MTGSPATVTSSRPASMSTNSTSAGRQYGSSPLPPPGSMSLSRACIRFSPDGVSRYSRIRVPPKLTGG